MPRRQELTWDKAGKRWKKKYRGRQLYLGQRGTLKTDPVAYQQALEEWRQARAKIDAEYEHDKPFREQYERAMEVHRKMLEFCALELQAPPEQPPTDRERFQWANELGLADIDAIEDGYTGAVVNPTQAEYVEELRTWQHRLQQECEELRLEFAKSRPRELDKPDTLPVTPYIPLTDEKRKEWEDRLGSLTGFKRWTGTTNPADTVSGNLDEFLRHKEQEARSRQISPAW